MKDYLQRLNEQQREAVLHIDGPIMIVAGAGSGKTKVLTTRTAQLCRCRYVPHPFASQLAHQHLPPFELRPTA